MNRVALRLRIRARRDSRTDPAVEQQVRTPVAHLMRAEHVVRTDIRHELVVDPNPRCAPPVVQIAVRVEDVEGVVPSRGGLPVVVQDAEELVLDGLGGAFGGGHQV